MCLCRRCACAWLLSSLSTARPVGVRGGREKSERVGSSLRSEGLRALFWFSRECAFCGRGVVVVMASCRFRFRFHFLDGQLMRNGGHNLFFRPRTELSGETNVGRDAHLLATAPVELNPRKGGGSQTIISAKCTEYLLDFWLFLLPKITGEDRNQLMKLQYRIGKLELDNMELEQSRIVHESAMRGKDLTIQKLQLQVTPAPF